MTDDGPRERAHVVLQSQQHHGGRKKFRWTSLSFARPACVRTFSKIFAVGQNNKTNKKSLYGAPSFSPWSFSSSVPTTILFFRL